MPAVIWCFDQYIFFGIKIYILIKKKICFMTVIRLWHTKMPGIIFTVGGQR